MGKSNTQQLAIAKKYLGEGGARFRKFCGMKGGAYCNAYVDYVFNEADNASLFCGGKKITYCPTSIKWCYDNLAMIPIYLAMPSDVIYFDWEPNGTPNHIGFVDHRISATMIATIEGNTSKVVIKNGKEVVVASGVVAERNRTLYNKKGTVKYIQAVFRPHFKASFKLGVIEVDGLCGYNTIANLQKALKTVGTYKGDIDGILGQQTIKAIQNMVGVKADGLWGDGTSKAFQKFLGVKQDSLFGVDSVKAMQKWVNYMNSSPSPKPTVKSVQDKICDWSRAIAADNSWHYVKWNSKDAKTKECPICHNHPKGKYHGWNCIGFCFASWRHGGGIKCNCSNHVINDDEWNDIYKAKTDAKALKIAQNCIGIKDIKVIRNKKGIPQSELKAADICGRFSSKGKFEHAFDYLGNGKMADCRGSNGKVATDKQISVRKAQTAKVAIRYTGK